MTIMLSEKKEKIAPQTRTGTTQKLLDALHGRKSAPGAFPAHEQGPISDQRTFWGQKSTFEGPWSNVTDALSPNQLGRLTAVGTEYCPPRLSHDMDRNSAS